MQSMVNKKLAFLLCFLINIIHFNECSTQVSELASITTNKGQGDRSNAPTEPVNDELLVGKSKQLRNVVMGSMHNYRSSYVGTKSRRLASGNNQGGSSNVLNNRIDIPITSEESQLTKTKKKEPINEFGEEIKYNVGPGVNISVEVDKELVSVYLDEDCLKDVFTGNSLFQCHCFIYYNFLFSFVRFRFTGRGRKQDLITKILPLFILPFLIQSAVVPFLVSTLKLLLIKSIVVGKIAIFLLLFSAFKNHVKYGYDASPSYYPDAPNRRTEAILSGYRVEGKPAAWIN